MRLYTSKFLQRYRAIRSSQMCKFVKRFQKFDQKHFEKNVEVDRPELFLNFQKVFHVSSKIIEEMNSKKFLRFLTKMLFKISLKIISQSRCETILNLNQKSLIQVTLKTFFPKWLLETIPKVIWEISFQSDFENFF